MTPPRDGDDLELNMTPMIDVVFNLIVFFMIVSDLTRKEIEDQVVLPRASMSVPDEAREERLILNVAKAPEHAETGAARITVGGGSTTSRGSGRSSSPRPSGGAPARGRSRRASCRC